MGLLREGPLLRGDKSGRGLFLYAKAGESLFNEEAKILIVRVIDSISDWLGKYLSLLFFPLVGILFLEVILRYVFDSPTLWAHETAIFLFGTIFLA